MALIDDFKSRFPEFDTTVVNTKFPLIENVWSCYYGGSYSQVCDKEIILNLLAHLLTTEINTTSGSIKGVASRSVGSVSESYATPSNQGSQTDFFNTTKYGQRYIMLTQKNKGGYFV